MKKKVIRLFRKVAFWSFYMLCSLVVPVVYGHAHRKGELTYLSHEDFTVWKKAMLAMVREYCVAGYNFRIRQVVFTFSNAKIEVIRKTEAGRSDAPIVVLCVKNDLQRIQMLVDHYRKLGVEKFAFLDNGSTDGTFEWLKEQKDIDLYHCAAPYKTAVKEGWINRIISHYGFERWYIPTDSDELMVYKGMEEHPLTDVVRYAAENGIKRLEGLTLDTYSQGRLFGNAEDIRKEYCWIDRDSYVEKEAVAGTSKIKRFMGGPRYRLMNSSITLSKFPLVHFEKGTISDSAHFQFPHHVIEESPCMLGILHYKFIDKDLAEYEKRAQKDSGFSAGGANYRQYLEFVNKQKDVSFMYEGSLKFEHSQVLENINLIQPLEWET